MTKQNNFTLIKRAKQLAIEETKAKVLRVYNKLYHENDEVPPEMLEQKVAKVK